MHRNDIARSDILTQCVVSVNVGKREKASGLVGSVGRLSAMPLLMSDSEQSRYFDILKI